MRCLRENTAPVYASGIHDAAVVVDMIIGPQRSHLEGRRLALPLESRGNPWEGNQANLTPPAGGLSHRSGRCQSPP